MSGQPRKRAVVAELERRARLEEITPLEYVTDWIAGGGSLSSLSRDMKAEGCEAASQPLLSRVVHAMAGAKLALSAARRDGADVKVDEAEQILEECTPDKDEIALAKARAENKLWQAERLNREYWGANEKQNINVNVSMGDLHIEALMQRNAARKELPTPAIPEAEYEVVSQETVAG